MNTSKTLSRRTLAKGTAWAAPVVLASSAIPAYASSVPDCSWLATQNVVETSVSNEFSDNGNPNITVADWGNQGGAGVSYKFADTYDNGRNPYAVNTPIERNPYHDFTFTYRITEDLRSFKATPWVNQATPVGEQNAKNNAVLDTQFNGVGYKVTGAQPIKQATFGWGSFNHKNIDGMPSKTTGSYGCYEDRKFYPFSRSQARSVVEGSRWRGQLYLDFGPVSAGTIIKVTIRVYSLQEMSASYINQRYYNNNCNPTYNGGPKRWAGDNDQVGVVGEYSYALKDPRVAECSSSANKHAVPISGYWAFGGNWTRE